MIASVTGIAAATDEQSVVVQVGGVGLRVFVPQTVLDQFGGTGQEITLYTHLHVRENELTLYGCRTEEERTVFQLLLTVSGIGPKVALAILSFLPPERLQTAIAQEDLATLARVPGIGPKTAKKLVFDLKDKVAAATVPGEPQPALSPDDADLIAALTGLGYSVVEAQEAIRHLPRESLPLEERVRLALSYFAS
ncbi:MAG: Holliday junction branch migration protein RuvA [Anaerolineae bacterium]|jgi:Holliday junction DNA helicase RuvA